ncbi:MAG: hypothetical protein AAB911_02020 [Patescibacteria group bacterium]
MAQDFFYIDPKKIPPRRVSGGSKKARPRISEPADVIEDNLTDYFPQFNLENSRSDLNTVLVSAAEAEFADDFSEDLSEEPADPLTAAIFGGGPFELEPAGDFFTSQPPIEQFNNRRISLAEQRNHLIKEHYAVLSELEDIENQDQKLTKDLARINLTRRYDSKISTPKISSIIQEDGAEYGLDSSVVEIDQTRANDDWFGVGLAYTPAYRPGEKIIEKNKNSNGNKTWLAGLAVLLIPLTFGWLLFSGSSNFVKNSVAAINSKLLSAASFTLINGDVSSAFPFLIELKNKMISAGAPTDALDKFIANNISFAWGDVFKKKAVWNESELFNGLDSLSQLKTAMLASPALENSGVFKKLAAELDDDISILSFWQELFRPGQSYLIVLGEAKLPRPIGGKPVSYVLVKTTTDGLEIINSGKINALDAATALKVVPPIPLQVFSTAWLPGESGWFLDFNESAKTLLNFFGDTAKLRPNGVIFVSQDGLNSLSLKEGLLFNAETPDWLAGLLQALARKPDSRIIKMANSINDLIQAHKIQFYFENDFLKKFVSSSVWAVQTRNNSKEDVLGLAWAGDKEGLVTEMAEHRSEIFENGSVKVRINLSLRQTTDNASENYYKIYLPRGSQISKIIGFSERKKIPKFDYAGQGFSADTRLSKIAPLENNASVDIFEETGLTVLGGWLNFEPDERKKVSMEYVLPFNLSTNSRGNYNIYIWRPHQVSDMPFRLIVAPQENVDILSLEPGGFISGNSGEYQGNLSQDLQLKAVLKFTP